MESKTVETRHAPIRYLEGGSGEPIVGLVGPGDGPAGVDLGAQGEDHPEDRDAASLRQVEEPIEVGRVDRVARPVAWREVGDEYGVGGRPGGVGGHRLGAVLVLPG